MKDKAKIREQDRASYARMKADPERWAKYVKRRAAYKNRSADGRRAYYARTYVYQVLERARYRASKKLLEFNLSEKDIHIPDVCPVLGIKLKIGGKMSDASPSLDRIDNTLGYVRGNIQIISQRANYLKRDATIVEVEKILRYMRENEF